ncbi:hypothetical protein PDTA9759_44780 [Phytobacter diazotrophicus]|uniref:Uncharacterized protein n=1 Tax=Phytobacter diazotrophicus TaxID=395631 RepID=A0ABM7W0E4_9ENTR|nr:hypothetical protein PDTA9734_44830 [Phytobacter diazotrophicus]BEG83924.1 hypothetical protein PDTA9730_43800 [Phytobacter diazotrophicus]BEG89822.1 hypothetical protein PDTA9759_44780 [Phytobacter diazotrophicus]BEG95586.1 hypothetical protein PDTA9832_44450 [Phytobacter diazotrophicus]
MLVIFTYITIPLSSIVNFSFSCFSILSPIDFGLFFKYSMYILRSGTQT